MKPKDILQIAVEVARREPTHKGHMLMAAASMRSDGLVVCAYNVQVKSQRSPHGHAEYRLHSKLTPGSTVAVARVTRAGDWALAKPCKACETILRNFRVKRVVYTISPGEFGTIIL